MTSTGTLKENKSSLEGLMRPRRAAFLGENLDFRRRIK